MKNLFKIWGFNPFGLCKYRTRGSGLPKPILHVEGEEIGGERGYWKVVIDRQDLSTPLRIVTEIKYYAFGICLLRYFTEELCELRPSQ